MNVLLYVLIVGMYVPLIYVSLRNRYFYKAPLFSVYFYSTFLFNVLGSIIIFEPSLSLIEHNLYTDTFFYILLIQALVFYAVFPIMGFFQQSYVSIETSFSKGYMLTILSIAWKIFFICWLGALLIMGLFFITQGVPPLVEVGYSGGNSLIISARSKFFEDVSIIWFYRIGFYTLPMLAGIIAYSKYKETGDGLKVFFISSAVASVLALMFLHKTPLALYWLSILLTKVFYEGKVSLKILLLWAIAILLALGTLYVLYYSGHDIQYYIQFLSLSLLNRIFGAYTITLASVPHVVNETGYLYGTSFTNPFGMFPYEVVNVSKMVHYNLFSIDGFAPPPAVGYAYADFGYFGVIFFTALICLVLLSIERLINVIKLKLFRVVLLVYLCIKIMFLAMQSISDILLNPVEVVIFLFLVLIVNIGRVRF